MLRLVFTDGIFICECDFENRRFPKEAGFRWSPELRSWYTENPGRAARLREYADENAKKKIDRSIIRRSLWSGALPFPDGLSVYDHQKGAALYALSQNKAYLGLAPRLGKTIISALIMNALKIPAVFITPPLVARNIEAEFKKWLTGSPVISRFDTREHTPSREPDVLIVPDSLLTRDQVRTKIKIMAKRGPRAVLFVDEAHRYKNDTAQRTKALFGKDGGLGIVDGFTRQYFLSGTPMPNRPIELFPILSKVAPETIDFMDKREYGEKFCGAFWDGYQMNYSGATNMDELERRVIGPFMLRLKKVPGLPAKIEEMVIIGDAPPKLLAMESKLLAKASPEDLVAGTVSSDHVATYRRELGKLKVNASIDFIRSLLDDSEESILVFAYHKEVIASLVEGLSEFNPLAIVGGTSNEDRHEIQQSFQKDRSKRLFIGNYLAAGIGIALDKADRVVFVEYSWVPADNDQASDRGNKIGGKDDLFVQYLVYENSIDRFVMETNFRKKKVTAHI